MPRKRWPKPQHFLFDQVTMGDLERIRRHLRGCSKTAAVKWAIMKSAERLPSDAQERVVTDGPC